MANDIGDTPTQAPDQATPLRRHPRFWLDDGSLVVRTRNDIYKVHRTLLHRHSTVLSSLAAASEGTGSEEAVDGCPTIHVPDERGVESADFEALLEHLYHDASLDSDAPFARVASVLRASSKQQLDFPSVHQLARRRLESMFPSEPVPFLEVDNPDEALKLAVDHNVYSIQKILFYTLATHANLDHDEPEGEMPPGSTTLEPSLSSDPSAVPPTRLNLSPELTSRCQALLNDLIAHFTPILFTVATAGHMACTDVFAEMWMPLVIQPALENNGLCRPLETLQTIIDLDWAAQGLCEECVKEKKEEWRGEQQAVWDRLGEWLGLSGKQ